MTSHLNSLCRLLASAIVSSMLVLCGNAHAQPAPGFAGNLATRIGDAVGAGVAGSAALNVAAGTGNAQSNTAVLAPGGIAVVSQRQATRYSDTGTDAYSHIGNQVFQNASGIMSINIASGNGNLQNNIAAIAQTVEIEAVADSMLLSATASRSRTGSPVTTTAHREATVNPGAFVGTSGVVQVNQAAGSGNVASNVFVLRPPAGTLF